MVKSKIVSVKSKIVSVCCIILLIYDIVLAQWYFVDFIRVGCIRHHP